MSRESRNYSRDNRFKNINPVKAIFEKEIKIDLSQGRKYDNNNSKELGMCDILSILSIFSKY